MAEAFGIACHELVSLDFRCGSCVTSAARVAAARNCTRDDGGPFGFGRQGPIALRQPAIAPGRLLEILWQEDNPRTFEPALWDNELTITFTVPPTGESRSSRLS